MCGILTYAESGSNLSSTVDKIQKYFNKLKHRGPDSTGSLLLGSNRDAKGAMYTVFLGFHRLAIVDPTKNSNKILIDDNIYLVCNGEIYNYKYLIEKYNLKPTTGSDCEVILQLYRHFGDRASMTDILALLDGVYAFVMFDRKKNLLFAARDMMGVRPLFIAQHNHSVILASEAKGIPSDLVKPFPPGVICTYKLVDMTYTLDTIAYNPKPYHISFDTSKKIIKQLLIDSVKKRLMSDRPVGFLLSGGLDSSIVAAIGRDICGTITTFSIGLPGSPDLVAAQKVSNHLKSEHHEVIITPDMIKSAVKNVIYTIESYDTTTVRASIPMYLLAKYISERTDIKVVLSGEGADELFGGYLYFHKSPSPHHFQQETNRLLKDLYRYDLLRSDRTLAAWGLEVRVPFLDMDLVSLVTNLDPVIKIPKKNSIEKQVLRDAFSDFLPEDIVYRQKEAFSDGIGYNSVNILKAYAKKKCPKSLDIDEDVKAVPKTFEQKLYYSFFHEQYGNLRDIYIDYYWMPKWCYETDDPSATTLTVHSNSGNKNKAEEVDDL